jgi:hypothetical protein
MFAPHPSGAEWLRSNSRSVFPARPSIAAKNQVQKVSTRLALGAWLIRRHRYLWPNQRFRLAFFLHPFCRIALLRRSHVSKSIGRAKGEVLRSPAGTMERPRFAGVARKIWFSFCSP